MRSVVVLSALAVTLAIVPASAAAQTIDTRGNTSTVVGGGYGLWGQSFTTTGAFTQLDNFSFWLGNQSQTQFSFRANIYAFNGTWLTGPQLFASAIQSMAYTSSGVNQVVFNTNGVQLAPNAVYMALIQRQEGGGLYMGYATQNNTFTSTYAGGQFYGGYSNPSDPALTPYSPMVFAPGNDLMFTANLSDPGAASVTPEPVSMILMGTGLAGLAAARKRRRRNEEI